MEARDALSIEVRRDQTIYVDGNKLSLRDFRVAVKTLVGNRSKNGVYIRADKDVPYGTVLQLIAIMSAAGITNVGFMTEPEEIR